MDWMTALRRLLTALHPQRKEENMMTESDPSADLLTAQNARDLLLCEARRWVGVTEQGGDNRGQIVEMIQRAVDNRAVGEPWCLALMWWLIQATERQMDALGSPVRSALRRTEHCMTMWRESPPGLRMQTPKPGDLVIWNHQGAAGNPTELGHVGLITGIRADGELETIEGNTGGGTDVEREGDGIYEKTRNPVRTGRMVVQGFLRVW